jgi:hypothetical protein
MKTSLNIIFRYATAVYTTNLFEITLKTFRNLRLFAEGILQQGILKRA